MGALTNNLQCGGARILACLARIKTSNAVVINTFGGPELSFNAAGQLSTPNSTIDNGAGLLINKGITTDALSIQSIQLNSSSLTSGIQSFNSPGVFLDSGNLNVNFSSNSTDSNSWNVYSTAGSELLSITNSTAAGASQVKTFNNILDNASGAITALGALTAATVTSTGLLTSNGIHSTGSISGTGLTIDGSSTAFNVTCNSVFNGNLTVVGSGTVFVVDGDAQFDYAINANQSITSGEEMSCVTLHASGTSNLVGAVSCGAVTSTGTGSFVGSLASTDLVLNTNTTLVSASPTSAITLTLPAVTGVIALASQLPAATNYMASYLYTNITEWDVAGIVGTIASSKNITQTKLDVYIPCRHFLRQWSSHYRTTNNQFYIQHV